MVLAAALFVLPATVSAEPVPTDVWFFGANTAFRDGGSPHPLALGLNHVVSAAAGSNYALFVNDDGTVLGLGTNTVGQLGNGTISDHESSPTQVKNLSGVTQVAAGEMSLALKNDGTVWAWGKQALGDGDHGPGIDVTTSTTPVQVKVSDVKAIAAGGNFVMALKNDGTVWMWANYGGDFYDTATLGQIALSHHLEAIVPMQVHNLSGVKAISAGSGFGLALKNDGTVWAWGNPGTPDTQPHPNPVQISGLDDVIQISAGGNTSYALKADNTVWAWGKNGSGQLGLGTITSANVSTPTPTRIPTLDHVISIASGGGHALALKDDGSVWSWGYGGLGETGEFTSQVNIGSALKATPSIVPGLPGGAIAIFSGPTAEQSLVVAPTGQPQAAATPVPQPQPAQTNITAPVDNAPTPQPEQPADTRPAAGEPCTTGTPSDAVTQDILNAINVANQAWSYAMRSGDASGLSQAVAGDLLQSDLADVSREISQGTLIQEVSTSFIFNDVTVDTPCHAVVHSTETWHEEDFNSQTHALLATSRDLTYAETYIVEFRDGGWIAISDDLVPIS
jgi:hypothetical protein